VDQEYEEKITGIDNSSQIDQEGTPSSSSYSSESTPASSPPVVVPTERSRRSCRVDSNTLNRTRHGIQSRIECEYCVDDGTTHFRASEPSIRVHEECKQIVLTGAFPQRHCKEGVLVEIIRDPEDSARMVFARYEIGSVAVFNSIKSGGRIFVPPDPTSGSFPSLSLPAVLLPCGDPSDLFKEVGSAIAEFVDLGYEQVRLVSAFVLASWFPDCFEAAPYLWVVGPLGSGKTKLLKLLWCLCRRGLIAGDVRSGSLYKLVDACAPTLIIDELDQGSAGASTELLRLLRTGSVPGVPTFRNGRQYSTYGLKVIASRQPISDAALLSRGVIISMLPSGDDTAPLDEAAMQRLEKVYQAKLCVFRFENYDVVRNHCKSTSRLYGLSGRMRQIGLALTAPFGEHHQCLSVLHEILGEHEDEDLVERSLEPEWLVAELLLEKCHEGSRNRGFTSGILVGEVATQVNWKLENQGEHLTLSPKKVGLVLKSLGLRTNRLGRSGRGLIFSTALEREIHEVAARLGIVPSTWRFGDPVCDLCERLRRHKLL
jgi:hypothetical protein